MIERLVYFMADIFDEIEEDLRRDRITLLWKRYGNYIVGVAVLIIVVVAGNQGFDYWKESKSQAAGDAFFDAVTANESLDALTSIVADLPEGYEMLAKFRIAALQAEMGNATAAEQSFLSLSRDDSIETFYKETALLLSVMNASETRNKSELIDRISSLSQFSGPLQGLALETTAGLYLELDNPGKALSSLVLASDLTDISPSLRQRISRSLSILQSNYGNVSSIQSE